MIALWHTLALACAGALVGFAVHRWLGRRLLRLIPNRWRFIRTVLLESRNFTRLLLITLCVAAMTPFFPPNPILRTTIEQAISGVAVFLVGWLCLLVLDHLAGVFVRRAEDEIKTDPINGRKHLTKLQVMRRSAKAIVGTLFFIGSLMAFPSVRQYGLSLLASAGVVGLVVGFAARPVLTNLLAGLQLGITQPIRIQDEVVVEGEWGVVEDIGAAFVVIRIWDARRLVVPLSYFIEKPFQNWTRESASLIGAVVITADYSVPMQAVREQLKVLLAASSLWDQKTCELQVIEANERGVQLRALVSARSSAELWELRCYARERLISYLQQEHPRALPKLRLGRSGRSGRQQLRQSTGTFGRANGERP